MCYCFFKMTGCSLSKEVVYSSRKSNKDILKLKEFRNILTQLRSSNGDSCFRSQCTVQRSKDRPSNKMISLQSKRSGRSWIATTITLCFASQSLQTLLNNKAGLGIIPSPTTYITLEKIWSSGRSNTSVRNTKVSPKTHTTQSIMIIGLSSLIINHFQISYLTH